MGSPKSLTGVLDMKYMKRVYNCRTASIAKAVYEDEKKYLAGTKIYSTNLADECIQDGNCYRV